MDQTPLAPHCSLCARYCRWEKSLFESPPESPEAKLPLQSKPKLPAKQGSDFSSSQQALFPFQLLYFHKVSWKIKCGTPLFQKSLLGKCWLPTFWQTLKLNAASLFISFLLGICTSLLSSGSNFLVGKKKKDSKLLHKQWLVTRGKTWVGKFLTFY